jgi:ABC-type Fe3+ transport system permease subunit
MDDSGTANSGTGEDDQEDGAARQDADGGRPARQGLARYARPALIAGGIIAVVCVALLVIIFFLDSFNATVYSVGGQDVQDATDQAKAIRENYAGARAGGIVFLVLGVALAAAGGLVLYRHRNEAGTDDGDNGEDVDFEDLGGR